MNERIKELMIAVQYENNGSYYSEAQLEHFAELIIKETLQVARVGMEFGPSMDEAVYTYFGVE